MGYNSVAIILNDALGEIERDPEFGRRVSNAVRGWHSRKHDQFATSASARAQYDNGSVSFASALTVLSQDHADGEQVVIVHGNTGQRCQDATDLGWQALNAMAECLVRHGYAVTILRQKKPAPRPDQGRAATDDGSEAT